MAAPLSDWSKRIGLLLLDKGPVPFDEAVAVGMEIVPPHIAWRAGERHRIAKAEKHVPITSRTIERYKDKDEEMTVRIRSGAREIVRSAVWTNCRNGRFETYEEDDVKMIRLGPNPWTREQLL